MTPVICSKTTQARRTVLSFSSLLLFVFPAVFFLPSYTESFGQVVGEGVYRALETTGKVRVVVAFRDEAISRTDIASRMTQIKSTRERALSRLGAADFTLTDSWDTISAVAGEITLSGVERLLADPDVLRVDLDTGGEGGLSGSVPFINADAVHSLGFTGFGMTVAVLDTGVDTAHPDLSDDLIAQHCFCRNSDGTGCCPDGSTEQSGPGSAEDDHGHGTNVTGIITSNGTVAPTGVAPDAEIVAVKVLDGNNRFASTAQVISGLDWIIVNRPDVDVVNMSLGTDALFSGLCDNAAAFTMAFASAIDTLRASGVSVFVASMNDGSATALAAPACVSGSAAVGAVYDADTGSAFVNGCLDTTTAPDKVACFTNSNTVLDLLAPGVFITSAGIGGGTSTFSGTSQAAAHASGSAAVLLDADPTLSPDGIQGALEASGVVVTDTRNGLSFPRIDLLAALNDAVPQPTPTPTPAPTPTTSPSPTPTPTSRPSPTPSPSPTPTSNPSPTPSPLPDPTISPSPSPGPTLGDDSGGSGGSGCTVAGNPAVAMTLGDFLVFLSPFIVAGLRIVRRRG